MDFKAYIEQKRKESHIDILKDICMTINNCADCHNEETHTTECCPCNCLNLQKVSEKCFYIEPYDSKTNRKLFEIASQYGYKTGFVMDDKSRVTHIKFYK